MSKRRNEVASGSSPSKRNRTHQSEWGLAEVLAECGCLLRGTPDADDESRNDVGCQLESRVTSTTLCSSLKALLTEMASGVDQNNAKILASLEETLISSLDDFGEENTEENTGERSSLLRRMLLPMYRNRGDMLQSQMSQMSQSPSRSASGIKTESYSLIQVLLRIDVLQTKLLTSLVQLLPNIASKFESDDGPTLDEDVPRLIFQNLRWIDHIIDSASLIGAFGECLTVLSSTSVDCPKTKAILLDAIATLPELSNNCNSLGEGGGVDKVLEIVQMLRREDPSLLVPCLDAIDSMPLSSDEVQAVMNDALEALRNTEAWGLPALTSFLINNCPRGGSGMTTKVIEEFRDIPLGDVSGDGMMRDECAVVGARSTHDTEALMIEALSRGFAHRTDLTSTLLKSIKETKPGYHKTADIWLLACCATASHNKSQVKSVFRSKANDGSFTSKMVREAIKGNGVALTSLFDTALCDLADSMLRSSDDEVCELGVTLYEVLFEEFKEPMQRQEVVGSLVTHVGAGAGSRHSEVDAAMRTFSSIISKTFSGDESGAAALRPFTPFLTSLLEHLIQMTPSQVRRLFTLLFTIGADSEEIRAGGGAQDGGAINEASIIIKKYLGLQDDSKKRIGIIGSVSFAVSMSALLGEFQHVEQSAAAASTDHKVVQEITSLLDFALSHCEPPKGAKKNNGNNSLGTSFREGRAIAYLLHELASAVRSGKLLSSICEWLDERFQTEFEESYIGDFPEQATQDVKLGKGDGGNAVGKLYPIDNGDLAILNGTSSNKLAPPGDMRFNLVSEGLTANVYVKILSLVSSPCILKREILPIKLCPQFTLIATLKCGHLDDIDGILDAPLFLPSSECSGVEFTDMSPSQQWVATSSYFFAVCWVRELINAFVKETLPNNANNRAKVSTSLSSQGFNIDRLKKSIVARLKHLEILQDELRHTASKCYSFAPPNLDVLAPPKALFHNDDGEDEVEDASFHQNVDPNDEKAVKKANKTKLKLQAKRAKQNEKSKAKKLSAKRQYEETLADRTMAQICPLAPTACVALGFPTLRPCGDSSLSQLSVSLSQSSKQVQKIAEPGVLLLLNVLKDTLSKLLLNKQVPWFKSDTNSVGDSMNTVANPYGMELEVPSSANNSDALLLASCDSSSRECFSMIDTFLEAEVFQVLFEHLAIIAERRKTDDVHIDGSEERMIDTANLLFSCIDIVLSSNKLTRSSTGMSYLASILKALSEGAEFVKPIRQLPTAEMTNLLYKLLQLIDDVIFGAHTDDMEFVMNGVSCMSAIEGCARRLGGESSEIKGKLSEAADSLLKRGWPDTVKLNKSNVGKMLSLLLDNSCSAIPNNAIEAVQLNIESLGRIEKLRLLVNDALGELPNTEKCKGPVDLFQTCTSQTFNCYYSVVLLYLHKELSALFESSLGKTKDPTAAKRTLEYVHELVSMMKNLFVLTKSNQTLAKKHALLQQLKWGTRFIETLVSKALPFFHTHFQKHQQAILHIIKESQDVFKQIYRIIAHGKRVKDSNLAKETPRSKKALELFTHKVKALLKKNRCLTAMSTAPMRPKDIDGTILTEDNETVDQDDSEDEENDNEEEEDESEREYETDDQSVEED